MKNNELKRNETSAHKSRHSESEESLRKLLKIHKKHEMRLLEKIEEGDTTMEENLKTTKKQIAKIEAKLAGTYKKAASESKHSSEEKQQLGFAQEAAKLNQSQQRNLHLIEEVDHEVKKELLRGGQKIVKDSVFLKFFSLFANDNSAPKKDRTCCVPSFKS